MTFDDDPAGIPIVYSMQPLDPSDLARWAGFLPTVRVGGALPVTFRLEDTYVIVEVTVPYVPPGVPCTMQDTTAPGPLRIPLLIAEGFPVPLAARFKLPPFRAESAVNFIRHIVHEIYHHEADEQLRVGDRRPFAPEH